MTNNDNPNIDACSGADPAGEITSETRALMAQIRRGMLRLHKAILTSEKAAYEKEKGPIASPHALLELLMHDPWFGWFRPLSETVVQIDEMLDSADAASAAGQKPGTINPDRTSDKVPSEADAQELLREVRSLLQPAETGEEFATKYRRILQDDPDIILAHAELSKILA